MPRPKGFEPYMNLWGFQYQTASGFLRVRFYRSEQSYVLGKPFFQDPGHGTYITVDYGKIKWLNNGSFILANLNNIGVFDKFVQY